MIKFPWIGIETAAEIVDGQWVHGLSEIVAILTSIVDPANPNALQIAAERLGGVVVNPPTGEPADGSA